MVDIEYSPTFAKAYKRLPNKIKRLAESKEKIFRKNPFHPSLKTHKLIGKFSNYWSFSINYQYRIIFSFASKHLIRFHTVGTHAVYEQMN